MLMTLVLPATIFVAIFRRQLWNIDLILNRTLVYGSLTAGVIAVYALVVGGLGALLHTRSNLVLSLINTASSPFIFNKLQGADRAQAIVKARDANSPPRPHPRNQKLATSQIPAV